MCNVRERVRSRIEELGLNYADLSRRVGKNHSYIQQYLGRGVPRTLPEDVRARVANELGLEVIDLTDSETVKRYVEMVERVGADVVDGSKTVRDIPEYEISSKLLKIAGSNESPDRTFTFPKSYVEALAGPDPHLVMVTVTGDSMAPTLVHGDRVMINLNDSPVSPSGVFVISENDLAYIRRLQTVPGSKPVQLMIIPDNKKYTQSLIEASDIDIVGRVIWVGHKIS